MNDIHSLIKNCLNESGSRVDFWTSFVISANAKHLAEVGVYRGDFAQSILERCVNIESYYMIDPWCHLDDWNKPANKSNQIFEQFLSETITKTDFAAEKRIILRGKTRDVIEKIPDDSLDFAYIDGDHTLKGITIDLINVYPKIKDGGWIGGDDFSETVWQHSTKFEPTLVFPFAVYFAEAVDTLIFALPQNQFLIHKSKQKSFAFVDLTKNYVDVGLRHQFHPDRVIKLKFTEAFRMLNKVGRQIKGSISRLR